MRQQIKSTQIKSNQMFIFGERGKPEYPGKNLSEQSREPTNSTHIWRTIRESNPGHTGGRPVLSPLRQQCSQLNMLAFLSAPLKLLNHHCSSNFHQLHNVLREHVSCFSNTGQRMLSEEFSPRALKIYDELCTRRERFLLFWSKKHANWSHMFKLMVSFLKIL